MRVAALYDIHGNLPALRAVLHDVQMADVDRVLIGGDVVPGPLPLETLDFLRALDMPTTFIRGNGERAVLARKNGEETPGLPEQARNAIRWVAEQLRPTDEQAMKIWPETARMFVHGLGDVLFCHATPRNDHEIFTRLTPEQNLLPVFAKVSANLVVCGHTHMQFDRTVGNIRVLNAGSVGMPFGDPGAYWLLLSPQPELRRTMYDLEKAAEHVRQTSFPGAEQFATGNILQPPGEAEILKLFAKAELR